MRLSGAALLLCAAGLAAAPAPAPGTGTERRAPAGAARERRAQFASWDEVNVLAHGLLQLGHGLKEHVERTKGQLRELGGRLSAHNSSLGRLLRQAREAQERGERLRGSVRELEGRGRQLLNLSEALRQRLEEVAADKDAIQGRLERLEGRVRLALQARPDGNQSARDLGALQVSAGGSSIPCGSRGGLAGPAAPGWSGIERSRQAPGTGARSAGGGGHSPDPLGDTGSGCGKERRGDPTVPGHREWLQESGGGTPGAPSECRTTRASRSYGTHLALPSQSLMDAQNLRIEELLQKIKQQQYKLDKQNLQIKSLQSKVSPWLCYCPYQLVHGHTGVDTPGVPALVAVLTLGTLKVPQLRYPCCSASSVM